MQKYERVAGTGNDIVHTKAVDNFGVMLPGFGHDDLLCFPLGGADSNSEPLQAVPKASSLTSVSKPEQIALFADPASAKLGSGTSEVDHVSFQPVSCFFYGFAQRR